MRPLLHPWLVNGRTGDPTLYVDVQFEKRALLLDIGDLHAVPPRKLLRIGHVFVSHCHLDHFVGLDHLLRFLVGRPATLGLYGPEGLTERVGHRLAGYTWNLVERFAADLVVEVVEMLDATRRRGARLRLKSRFAPEPFEVPATEDGILLRQPDLLVRAAVLDHGTPCLAFAVEEAVHVNVWRNRVEAAGLPVGPWLRALKRAVAEARPDEYPVAIEGVGERPLGALRPLVTTEPGQKIGYVTDIAGTEENIAAAAALVEGADILFIEATFAAADAARAVERGHLTTVDAGTIARRARARRVEPFHFSPRYGGEEARLVAEVMAAYGGDAAPLPEHGSR